MTDVTSRFINEAPSGHPNVTPRDAATLILLDRSGPEPRVLMGKRHHGHVFLPGKYVFPGGAIDDGDRRVPVAAPLDPRAERKLMRKVRRPNPTRARALALAAIRETYEETGMLIGRAACETFRSPAGPWEAFASAGIRPDLSAIHFIARAITPPRRSRRYDTRFFAADASAVARRTEGAVGPDSELVELAWLPLKEAIALDILAITQIVLGHLQEQIAAGFSHDLPVPFYRLLHGRRILEML